MADIGHSVLLKFFISTSKMSKSKQEIESNVPKNQELRGDLSDIERGDADDAVYSPVITVTKEETTLTKGDLKVQKVVVSENVSDRIMVKTTEVKEINNDDSKVIVSVTKEEAVYTSGNEKDENDVNNNPKQTRIPKPNFKQTVDRVKRQERSLHEKAVHEPMLGIKVRSSIPRLKETKQTAQKIQQNREGKAENSKKLDDEFDKIYEEIKDNATDVSIPTPESLRDAEIVDSIFEEIIHAYDDNVETLKQEQSTEIVKSKIPLLKRKSEQDILVPSIRRDSFKKRNSIDDSKIPVQTKSLTVKDLESTTVKNSKISESYAISKSESITGKKIELLETTSEVKSIRSQKSIESDHTNVSSRQRIAVKSNEAPKCKIPIKSDMRDQVESNLSSAPLNKHPGKRDIIDNQSSHKIDVGISEPSITKTVVEVKESNISHATVVLLADEHETTANAYIIQSEGKLTNKPIIKTNLENQLSATTATEITSNIGTINLNSSSPVTSTETKGMSQNINTQTSEKNISVVSAELESVLSQSENLSPLNVNLITEHSDESNNVKVQSTNGQTKITEISTTDVQVINSLTSKVVETSTTLEYDLISIDSNSQVSRKRNVRENQSSSNFELQNTCNIFENSKDCLNNKKEVPVKDNDSNKKVNESELVSISSNESQTKFAFDKKESAEHNSIKRIHSMETISTSTIDISKYNNNSRKIKNTETTENTSHYGILNIDNNEKLSINNIKIENKASNIVRKEMTIESSKESGSYIREDNITKNTKTINTNNDSEENKIRPEIDNATVNVHSKSLISSQIKNINDLDEEDIIVLKGKVNRVISRLDSREGKIEKTENDIPRNVSVVSKVAIFERNEPEIYKNETDEVHVQDDNTKPIIVDEILKPNQYFEVKEREVFNHSKSEEKSFDYYSVYNKVHSSVLRRLRSIETKSNHNFNDEAKKDEMKINKMGMKATKINEDDEETEKTQKNKIGDKLIKSEIKVAENKTNGDVPKEKSFNCYNRTKSLAELRSNETNNHNENIFDIKFKKFNEERRAKSLAELDLGHVVKGRVRQMVMRMNSIEKESKERRVFERCQSRGTILARAAVFEKKIVPIKAEENVTKTENTSIIPTISEEELKNRIEELSLAKTKYGKWENMLNIELRDGSSMPVIAIGTALLEPKLIKYIVSAAIDLGYRAIDTAFIYGNEKEIGEAIRSKIEDGTVKREDLFIMSKLWSTFHRRDLVETACRNSLQNMGLEYFDLFMIHNPMSFREGPNPLPKIANVLQYSQHDYLEAWFGMETVVAKGLAKRIGLSNFNSTQVDRIMDKAKFKPVVNQVECHPYLNQHNLGDFCANRNIKLSCFGVLGSKGTPLELKSEDFSVIDDPLVQVMAAGLGVTPAQLLIAYQLFHNRNVVVKSSTGAHLWKDLQALNVTLDQVQISALDALNKNKRIFTFKGMGDTHKNYPFKNAF